MADVRVRRAKCGECGKLVPSDSGLACKIMATTGDGRALIGTLERTVVGKRMRLQAVPRLVCIGCAVAALQRALTPPLDSQPVQP